MAFAISRYSFQLPVVAFANIRYSVELNSVLYYM